MGALVDLEVADADVEEIVRELFSRGGGGPPKRRRQSVGATGASEVPA